MNEDRDTLLKTLKETNAGCFELAWNGFIRLYEEGEKRCECKDCIAADKLDKESKIPEVIQDERYK